MLERRRVPSDSEVVLERRPRTGRRMLERLRDLESLVVMNDEAHHIHDDDLEWSKTLMGLHQSLPRAWTPTPAGLDSDSGGST